MRARLRIALLPLMIGGFFGSGCVTPRAVSDTYWSNPDTLYVVYSEGSGTGSRVKKCSRNSDNHLICEDQLELNTLLAK